MPNANALQPLDVSRHQPGSMREHRWEHGWEHGDAIATGRLISPNISKDFSLFWFSGADK